MQPETARAATRRTAHDTARACERAGVPLEQLIELLEEHRARMAARGWIASRTRKR